MLHKVKRFYHWYGLRATIQRAIQKLIGIADLQEEVDSLYYFLNTFHHASDVPPTTDPDLRLLQLCDTQLLRIVVNECEKLGLSYWLEFGTLLGAIRHKGFIPWDEDMDIAMPRKDYNRALIDLKEALSPMGIEIRESDHISICYKHEETGIWLDIFAIDDFYSDNNDEYVLENLRNNIFKFRKNYFRHINKATVEWKKDKRKKYIGGDTGKYHYLYLQPEFDYRKALIHSYESVFPLKKVFFEGYEINVPHDYDTYLKEIYGANYMYFPRIDVLKHSLGRGALSTWAKKNGVDMNLILKLLKSFVDE